jgi:multidrug efflux pump subunit AcrB
MYSRLMRPLLAKPRSSKLDGCWAEWWCPAALDGALPSLRWVVVKMMPYDNKSELQVVIDAPEDYSLERTNAAAREMAQHFTTMPEVTDYQVYVGTSAPFNFNGLVRYYFMRSGGNVADIQVNLVDKHERDQKATISPRRAHELLMPIARKHGVNSKSPKFRPGRRCCPRWSPKSTAPTAKDAKVAEQVKEIFSTTEGIVDVDWMVEDPRPYTELWWIRRRPQQSASRPR